MSKKHGRPLKFDSVSTLEKAIDSYVASCWTQKLDMFGNPVFVKDSDGKKTDEAVMVQSKPYTISGLAVALGTSRETLLDYESGKYDGKDESGKDIDLTAEEQEFNKQVDTFSDTIKKAKQMCEAYAEESLFVGRNATGAIFNLKNNYGSWKDRTELGADVNHSGDVKFVNDVPRPEK